MVLDELDTIRDLFEKATGIPDIQNQSVQELCDSYEAESGVYAFHNPVTRKWYIGQAKDLRARVQSHIRNLRLYAGEEPDIILSVKTTNRLNLERILIQAAANKNIPLCNDMYNRLNKRRATRRDKGRPRTKAPRANKKPEGLTRVTGYKYPQGYCEKKLEEWRALNEK